MFDQKTVEEIKFYVYALFDPEQPRVPFYIGKGKGNRVFSHAQGVNLDQLEETTLSLKSEKIAEILRRGNKVRHTIIQYELTEEHALRVESALIDMVNHILPETLTNLISGIGAAENFIDAGDLAAEKCAIPLEAKQPLLLIKIERNWSQLLERYGRISDIPPHEIYEATRAYWRIDVNRARKADLVLSVARGLVRGVFVANEWQDAPEGKKQFVGDDVTQSLGIHLFNRSVSHLFPRGAQTPIRYLSC
jgi:uncharacterized protein